MSAPAVSAQDCCSPCLSPPITNIPGPAGVAGAAGAAGSNGANAFSTTNAAYTQPAVGGTVSVTIVSSAWAIIGEDCYVQNGGYYLITAIADTTHVTLQNRGYTGNAAPAAVIGSGQRIGPSGIKGTDGIAVGVTFNSISPTTTRGDIIVDNGANSPAAGDVRFPAGTDGQQLTALAAQPTGLIYRTITPNAATDNVIPRFDASGATTPTPLQSSGIQITDTTAIQTTAGNARGTSAVDLQPVRGVVTQVASGNNSTIAGGKNNTASGASSVAAGEGNVASGSNSTAFGVSNTASGPNAVAIGSSCVASNTNTVALGPSATASGSDSVAVGSLAVASGQLSICIANDSQATAQYGCVVGGSLNAVSATGGASIFGGIQARANKYGQNARSSGMFSVEGDCQTSELMWRLTTTDATANVEAFLDGIGASQRATVPLNTTWAFDILVAARKSDGTSACWRVVGGIKNDAGTTVLVAAVTVTVIADGTGGTWGVAGSVLVDADNGNDALRIRITGAAASTIRWSIRARIVETGH